MTLPSITKILGDPNRTRVSFAYSAAEWRGVADRIVQFIVTDGKPVLHFFPSRPLFETGAKKIVNPTEVDIKAARVWLKGGMA